MTDLLTDLEEDLIKMFNFMGLDSQDRVFVMLLLKNKEEGQIELVKYLRNINPKDYNKNEFFEKAIEISKKY